MQFRRNDKAFDMEAWEMFKDEFKSTPNALALGLGDYEDWLRPTMRSRLQSAAIGDDNARQQLDDKIRHDQDSLLNQMQFLEGKILGLHSGHHEWEFGDGTNSTQRICSALKAPYLGWMASTRLNINEPRPSQGSSVYTIVSMHGTGSAQAASTDARWLESRMVPAFVADQFVRGHSCKSTAWIACERHFVRRRGAFGEDIKPVRCLNVGGFSRGYTDGWQSSYVERAGLLPQPVGWAIIRMKTRIKCNPKALQDENRRYCGSKTPYLDIEQLTRNPRQEESA